MKRGFGKKEGCEFSKLKRFKPIQFSSTSKKWRVINDDETSGSPFTLEVTRTPSDSKSYESEEGISSSIIFSSSWSSLPDELVTEILVRLPVKSVLQCKSVCKRWYALFNTPTFIRRNHCLKSPHNAMLLLRRRVPPPRLYHQSSGGDDLVDIFSFHDLNSPERKVRPVLYTSNFLQGSSSSSDIRLLGSIDGIICMKHDPQSCYILCNPTLRQYKLVPPLLCDLPHVPRYSPQEVDGFGISYSSLSSSSSTSSRLEEELDFKIIVMHRFVHNLDTYARACGGFPNRGWPPLPFVFAHLYTWKTNSWRRLDDAPLIPAMPRPFNSIFLNGACHWCGVDYATGCKMILSFNMTSEVFLLLELPDCLYGNCVYPILVSDCLGVVQYNGCGTCRPSEIWVMKEYGVKESWTKQFVISPEPFVTTFQPWKNDTPFGTTFVPWKNDTMLLLQRRPLSVLLTPEDEGADWKCRDQLQSIDLHTSKIRKFQVFGGEGSLCGVIHEESLVSLN